MSMSSGRSTISTISPPISSHVRLEGSADAPDHSVTTVHRRRQPRLRLELRVRRRLAIGERGAVGPGHDLVDASLRLGLGLVGVGRRALVKQRQRIAGQVLLHLARVTIVVTLRVRFEPIGINLNESRLAAVTHVRRAFADGGDQFAWIPGGRLPENSIILKILARTVTSRQPGSC